MGAHDVVDLIDGDACAGKIFLEPIGVQHVPERARGAWLVVTDATIDQDGVVGGLHQIGLDAKHELAILAVEVAALGHPGPILLQHLWRQRGEEFQGIKERAFLFDDAVDRDVADLERGGHWLSPPKAGTNGSGAGVVWLPGAACGGTLAG